MAVRDGGVVCGVKGTKLLAGGSRIRPVVGMNKMDALFQQGI